MSDFNLFSERGTIIRLSPDWKRRDIIATGLRWPVSLAFNAAGDLFCTDQEGATWLANGNPFDELLHIEKGRHYGFPPRHPRHLPGVIDEPSVFDYVRREEPQPVAAYAASPTETRVIFDRPLDPARWRTLARQAGITRGDYVAAGDRYESHRSGTKIVRVDQAAAPRIDVPVHSAVLAPDLHSLTLRHAPRAEEWNYAVKLPESGAPERPRDAARGELAQHAAIDVLTNLTGAEAEWRDAAGAVQWRGWLPHLDLKPAREFAAASAEHARLFERLRTPGTLTLRAQLDLSLMLRPAIQPGSTLDFEYPAETVTVAFKAGGRIGLKAPGAQVEQTAPGEPRLTVQPRPGAWQPLEIALATGEGEPALDVAWHTAEDVRPRALPLRRVLLPWARPPATAPVETKRMIPEIAGGDWARGKAVFASAKAACAVCHQSRGEGGIVGPELTNLVHRDYASVLQDIVEPSAAINPDRIAYEVTTRDETTVAGIILEDHADRIVLADVTGAQRTIPRAAIRGMTTAAISLMPPGLWQGLSLQEQKDLMTFLLTEAPAGR